MSAYTIRFKIPLKPPSVNSLYNVFRYGPRLEVKLKPEIIRFKSSVKGYVPRWEYKHTSEILLLKITLHDEEYLYKNGKMRKFDITNTEKALIDAISEKIGVDDSYFKHVIRSHVPSKDETYMDVEIVVMKEGI